MENFHITFYIASERFKRGFNLKIFPLVWYIVPIIIQRHSHTVPQKKDYVTLSHNPDRRTCRWWSDVKTLKFLCFQITFTIYRKNEVGLIYPKGYHYDNDKPEGIDAKYKQLCSTDYFN